MYWKTKNNYLKSFFVIWHVDKAL